MLAWLLNLNFAASGAAAPTVVAGMKQVASPRSAGSLKVRG